MTSDMIGALIPIVAVLATFGFPVAIVFVLKYFKLKERELAIDVEARQKAQQQQFAIEERVRRLEDVLLNLDHDVRARLGLGQPGAPLPSAPDLVEPPTGASDQGASAGPMRQKAR
jgi:hypothetical protein